MKKFGFSLMLVLILIGMLTLVFDIEGTRAEWTGTVYIRADGSIDPPDAPILTFDCVTYTLTGNIASSSEGIVIERDNLIIDGSGYTIQGSCFPPKRSGIYIESRNNVTIKNVIIKNFYFGIKIYNFSSNCSVKGNNITNNTVGIVFYYYCANNDVSGNNITNNGLGVWLYYSNCNIRRNNISNNGPGSGIWFSASSNNIISENNITANSGYGISLDASDYNAISNNKVTANFVGILFDHSSYGNSVNGNSIANNDYGIAFLRSSNHNKIFHNNFVSNNIQVYSNESANIWDNGYPDGGNFWSDYTGVDVKSGPNQDQPGSDGIGDTSYVIDEYNVDWYPLMQPFRALKKSRFSSLYVSQVSNSALGTVLVISSYISPFPGRNLNSIVSIPENVEIETKFVCSLIDDGGKSIAGRNVKLLLNSEVVSSCITTDETFNIRFAVPLKLPYGLYNAELRFEGDEEYSSSSLRFIIIAYRSSSFNITKDAYNFGNWEYTFDEHLKMIKALLEENVIDIAYEAALTSLYPFFAKDGHCFGMAASSSVYFVNPSLKPKPVDTYAFSKDDVQKDINWYHLSQMLWYGEYRSVDSSLNGILSLINSGIPVVLAMKNIHHTVTIIGYYESDSETFLMVYDNNNPNAVIICSVVNGKILYGPDNVTEVCAINPNEFPSKLKPSEFLKNIFRKYIGLTIHSPVDIEIASETGKKIRIQSNTLIKNDFTDSYIYLNERNKIIMLPSNETFYVNVVATDYGEIGIDFTCMVGDDIITYQYHNLTVNSGDKIYLNSTQPEIAYFDSRGDGIIDREIYAEVVPEFPSATISTSLILIGLIITVLLKKSEK